ncbi:hypothetical protein EDB84DRAFT_1476741 [Lactarius hengduanensis]|nr:hypothetical protein EDB84DRAFT_1476741 [Lactarius hengduanensis]
MLSHRNIRTSTPGPRFRSLPASLLLSLRQPDSPVRGYSTMSISVPQLLPPDVTQSQASIPGPGIASLFIQGIESGLVLAYFSQWFCARDLSESPVVDTTIVIFVTVVGLAQSGICFASAWTTYVQRFGLFLLPDWNDYIHPIPNLLISAPVQALMIRRCYILVGKNMLIVTPLVLLLVAAIVVPLWSIISIVKLLTVIPAEDILPSFQGIGVDWLYLMSLLLPTVLDLVLTGVLLRYLTRTRKRVYAEHTRKWISRIANIVWQSALPPTLCTICLSVIYVQYSTMRQTKMQLWSTVIQAMIGKLYVLSLFYMINARPPLQPDERPTAFMSTLTVPTVTEVVHTLTRDARGDAACGEISAGCKSASASAV